MAGRKPDMIPVDSIDFKGEIILDVMYSDFNGRSNQYWIFKSGKVVVLPVYNKCPCQVGTIQNLKTDFPEMLLHLENKIRKTESTIKELQERIKMISEE